MTANIRAASAVEAIVVVVEAVPGGSSFDVLVIVGNLPVTLVLRIAQLEPEVIGFIGFAAIVFAREGSGTGGRVINVFDADRDGEFPAKHGERFQSVSDIAPGDDGVEVLCAGAAG